MVLFSSSTSRSSLSATSSRVAASSSARVAVFSSTVAAVVVVTVVSAVVSVEVPPLSPQAVMLIVRASAEIPARVFFIFFIPFFSPKII